MASLADARLLLLRHFGYGAFRRGQREVSMSPVTPADILPRAPMAVYPASGMDVNRYRVKTPQTVTLER